MWPIFQAIGRFFANPQRVFFRLFKISHTIHLLAVVATVLWLAMPKLFRHAVVAAVGWLIDHPIPASVILLISTLVLIIVLLLVLPRDIHLRLERPTEKTARTRQRQRQGRELRAHQTTTAKAKRRRATLATSDSGPETWTGPAVGIVPSDSGRVLAASEIRSVTDPTSSHSGRRASKRAHPAPRPGTRKDRPAARRSQETESRNRK